MSRLRPKVSLSAEEAAALEAHPEYQGSLGPLLRSLALRQIGLTPADPYAAHKSAPRDEKGRMMNKYFCEIYEASKHGITLPAGLTHLAQTHGHTPDSDQMEIGFPSLAAAQAFRKAWLNPKEHRRRVGPSHRGHGGHELKAGKGEGEFSLLYPEDVLAAT